MMSAKLSYFFYLLTPSQNNLSVHCCTHLLIEYPHPPTPLRISYVNGALDLESGRWYPIAPTLTKRDSLGLVNLDGGDQLYAVGGYDNLQNSYLR